MQGEKDCNYGFPVPCVAAATGEMTRDVWVIRVQLHRISSGVDESGKVFLKLLNMRKNYYARQL